MWFLCRGSGGPPLENFSVLRWISPLKFNSKHFGNPRDTGWTEEFKMAILLKQVWTTLRSVLLCLYTVLVSKRVKVIKKIVWTGERPNEGMKAFSFLFLQTFLVIYGQSCSEQQKKCAIVRVCLNSQTISGTSGWSRPRSVAIFWPSPNSVHEQ